VTAAVSSAELESQLVNADPSKIGADPAGFGSLIKNYVDANKADVQAQVAQQVQAALADFARDSAKLDGARPNLGANVSDKARPFYNAKAPGAALDGKFENLAEVFSLLRDERLGRVEAAQKLAGIRNALGSPAPADGGFLIPEEYRAELQRIALENSVVRANGARVIPMSVPRIKFPVLDSTSNASSVHGGIIAYWGEEGAALTASSPTFATIALDVHKLTGYTTIPNELLADSQPSVGPLVDELFPQGLAYFEDYAFIAGSGVGQPLGFLNAGAAITVSKESSQAADTLLWANIVKMYSRMLPTSLGSAVWIMNQTNIEQLLQMTLPVKNVAGTENVGGAGPVGITYGNGTSGPSFTLLGRPVILTEKVPAIGDLGDVNFVDLKYYFIGDRQQVSAATSQDFLFSTDTTAYRITSRVDGRPALLSALTPKTGSSTLSAFVKLEAR
jgi:HK97 family phage major capsid protein